MTELRARPRKTPPAGAPAAPTTPDPVEIAMEAAASGKLPAGAAEQVLLEQVRLARAQRRNENLQAALRVLSGIAGLLVVVAIGALAWNASRARGLVMEAFSVPPDMAAKGLTGQVVASQVLDQLNDINDQTKGMARPIETMRNDWGGALKVEIPETGISLDEVQSSLRDWLGHQTHARGEVYRTPDGQIAITVRVEGRPADTVTGPEADLGKLTRQAAEALYSRSQPYRYSSYLVRLGRPREAYEILTKLGDSGSLEDRPWALSGSVNQFAGPEAIARMRRGLKLAPNLTILWQNLGGVQRRIGHNEEALASARQAARAIRRADRGGWRAEDQAARHRLDSIVAELIGDLATAAREAALADAAAGPSPTATFNGGRVSRLLAENHDLRAAENLLLLGKGDAELSRAGATGTSARPAVSTRTAIARQRQDWAGVYRETTGLEAYLLAPPASDRAEADPVLPVYTESVATLVRPYMAEALAHLGRLDEARAMIAATPADCYLCLRKRGEIAFLSGDANEGARWYAEASRQGSSLPFADAEWGQALLRGGNAAGAIAHFAEAHRRSPRFPDALAGWGEALLAKGDARAASAKFQAAAKLAPRWGRLHLKWGEALAKLGKKDQAQEHWRTAAALDLTADERAELARLQGAK